MTNTANTPVETLERVHPVRVWRYSLRDGSGGGGRHRGGDGVVKEVEFLTGATAAIIGDRRSLGPPGAAGGAAGAPASDALIEGDGTERLLPAYVQLSIRPGQRVRIATPGGGGWGPGAP